ncbi:MAG TPA: response regulator transcription factor [Candidatus Stackebrandtia excrementipullorum]|nr:response regulator transcription factor [Candidatus Stackebrandtia excrementipullorum]
MSEAHMLVVLYDPVGRIEAAVVAAVSDRRTRIRTVRIPPARTTCDRLYIMDHHRAWNLLVGAGRHRPRILAVTTREDGHVLKEAVAVGAVGLLSRHRLAETLDTALDRIRQGDPYYDHLLLWATVGTRTGHGFVPRQNLTAREEEVLAGIVAGHTTRAMAQHLGISVATVRSHVHKVLTKLGVHSRLEAATLVMTGYSRRRRH